MQAATSRPGSGEDTDIDPSTAHPVRGQRPSTSLVGRDGELEAIEERLATAADGLAGVVLEGEPGIGKSTIVLAAAESAASAGWVAITVSADEEIRGPFLCARSLFSHEAIREAAADAPETLDAVDRAYALLSGRDPALEELPPEQRVLRIYDQAALALRAVAEHTRVALFLDDAQWADEDSLRVIRYIARTERSIPLFLLFAMRPDEGALVTELTTLLADLERMSAIQRIPLGRFRQTETTELLRRRLGGQVDAEAATAIQRQAEGVPFIIDALANTYRDSGLLQSIDGAWRLGRKAGALMPSSVRTLIQRRAARLPEPTKEVLAEAAILGRSFRLADLCALRTRLGVACDESSIAEALAPASAAGLLGPATEGSGGDYRFSHEQIREFSVTLMAGPRRREVNAAILEMLDTDGEPTSATLLASARHALDSGDAAQSARFSVRAAQTALGLSAPEEALRVVERALATAAAPKERVALLTARDDGLAMMRRTDERLEGITELSALAEASNDVELELAVMLRRADALRHDDRRDAAAGLARTVRTRSAERGDRSIELAACMELGQDLMGAALGEGYASTPLEADLAGAEEAYARAVRLAEELGDERNLAHATRELGVVMVSHLRAGFVETIRAGEHVGVLKAVSEGVPLDDLIQTLPIAPIIEQARTLYLRALESFEKLGDRRGAMSTIIAMAYLDYGPEIRVGANPAQRIEEIRRLALGLQQVTRESGREAAEAQMLYGVHIFARSKVVPDLAISRGEQAWEAARAIGDRALEFLAAGGTALAYLDIGDIAAAEAWLTRAAASASAVPTPHRAWQLELWRARTDAAQGNSAEAHERFGQAVRLCVERGRVAAQVETLAAWALEAGRMGYRTDDAGSLDVAERSTREVLRLASSLPGRPPWKGQALATLARVGLARGRGDDALRPARDALVVRAEASREDPHIEMLVPAAEVIMAHGDTREIQVVRDEVRLITALVAQRTQDEAIRERWLGSPVGREMAALAGIATETV